MSTNAPTLLYCDCKYAQIIPEEVKKATLKALADSGQPFEAVADLCESSARCDPALARIAAGGEVKIAACFPRAVKWLFHAAGTPLGPERTEIVNMRALTGEQAAAAMLNHAISPNLAAGKTGAADAPKVRETAMKAESGTWKPWFPVIDYDRCTKLHAVPQLLFIRRLWRG